MISLSPVGEEVERSIRSAAMTISLRINFFSRVRNFRGHKYEMFEGLQQVRNFFKVGREMYGDGRVQG